MGDIKVFEKHRESDNKKQNDVAAQTDMVCMNIYSLSTNIYH